MENARFGWDGDSYWDDEMTWEERANLALARDGLRLATADEAGWYTNVNGVRGAWVTDMPAPQA